MESGGRRAGIGPQSELAFVAGGAAERGAPGIAVNRWYLPAEVAKVIVGNGDFQNPAPVGVGVIVEPFIASKQKMDGGNLSSKKDDEKIRRFVEEHKKHIEVVEDGEKSVVMIHNPSANNREQRVKKNTHTGRA